MGELLQCKVALTHYCKHPLCALSVGNFGIGGVGEREYFGPVWEPLQSGCKLRQPLHLCAGNLRSKIECLCNVVVAKAGCYLPYTLYHKEIGAVALSGLLHKRHNLLNLRVLGRCNLLRLHNC